MDLHPAKVMARLAEIEQDLAQRQNELEQVALAFHRLERDVELLRARTYLQTSGTVEDRKAATTARIADTLEWQRLGHRIAEYEALKVAVKVLTTRASIGQSILRAQSRDSWEG